MSRLRERFRKRLSAIAEAGSRFVRTVTPTAQKIGLQRMCPFCNLITPRAGRFCLECGKALANA
jgi:hypothetical protein